MVAGKRGESVNIMQVDGYKARIEYDAELDQFRGEILGINGSADFYGNNPAALRREFRKSLQVFLDVCREKGISPKKTFSGKFNLRISPQLHSTIAALAAGQHKSINEWVSDTLKKSAEGKIKGSSVN
jgi:predicted HicB family RNase H-like nuclease